MERTKYSSSSHQCQESFMLDFCCLFGFWPGRGTRREGRSSHRGRWLEGDLASRTWELSLEQNEWLQTGKFLQMPAQGLCPDGAENHSYPFLTFHLLWPPGRCLGALQGGSILFCWCFKDIRSTVWANIVILAWNLNGVWKNGLRKYLAILQDQGHSHLSPRFP